MQGLEYSFLFKNLFQMYDLWDSKIGSTNNYFWSLNMFLESCEE